MVPDALSRNLGGVLKEPTDDLDDKIYPLFIETENFKHQLKLVQEKDTLISDAKSKILTSETIQNGRLRHVRKQLRVVNDILTKNGRPVVPNSLRRFVVDELHKNSHFACDKLYPILQRQFCWPNMYRYVKNHISSCDICQRCKPSIRPPKAPLLPMHEPEYPMQFITIDIGYMVKDEDGFKYILLIGDIFSKFKNK